ncbi:MAG: hypothetical protein ACTSWW_08955 [Promethearchaeota archaeon]
MSLFQIGFTMSVADVEKLVLPKRESRTYILVILVLSPTKSSKPKKPKTKGSFWNGQEPMVIFRYALEQTSGFAERTQLFRTRVMVIGISETSATFACFRFMIPSQPNPWDRIAAFQVEQIFPTAFPTAPI